MSAHKHARDDDWIDENNSKRSKVEWRAFYKTLSNTVGGKPTKSRLERLKSSNLVALCSDFGLWDNASGGKKPTKVECVKRIMSCLEGLEVFSSSDDADSDSGVKPRSTVRVRLYRNPSDYETRYIAEVEAPRLPCGGLSLRDLSDLFQSRGKFEVIESARYKPILIHGHNGLICRELLDILLRDSLHIRVICIACKP